MHISACEGESQWNFFASNYQEYEADKKKRLGEEGAKPKRIRFKALKYALVAERTGTAGFDRRFLHFVYAPRHAIALLSLPECSTQSRFPPPHPFAPFQV